MTEKKVRRSRLGAHYERGGVSACEPGAYFSQRSLADPKLAFLSRRPLRRAENRRGRGKDFNLDRRARTRRGIAPRSVQKPGGKPSARVRRALIKYLLRRHPSLRALSPTARRALRPGNENPCVYARHNLPIDRISDVLSEFSFSSFAPASAVAPFARLFENPSRLLDSFAFSRFHRKIIQLHGVEVWLIIFFFFFFLKLQFSVYIK